MDYSERISGFLHKYTEALQSVPGIAVHAKETGRMPVFGMTSNLDIVLKWDAERFNELLDRYLHEAPVSRVGEVMREVSDFVRISADYMIRGLGGNFDIGTGELCDFLRGYFDTELALGGTCAQGAAALATIGVPVNVHISDMSREVCAQMDREGLTAIDGGAMVPVAEAASDEPPVCHFILQYRKGDIIRIAGEEYEIPSSNRMILFFDKMQKDPPFDESFFSYWENAKQEPSSLLVSGFDAIVDEEVAAEKTDALTQFIAKLRKRSPGVKVYFEGAFYMNPDVKTLFMRRLGPSADMVGMNEEELAAHIEALGGRADLSCIRGITEALETMLREFSLRGVVLHSKDHAIYYGAPLQGVSIEDGLTMGHLMACTRAVTGHYGTLEEIKKVLYEPLSETGLALACEAESWTDPTGERSLAVVPSICLEQPKYTVGLGDTFVAGVHTCFI